MRDFAFQLLLLLFVENKLAIKCLKFNVIDLILGGLVKNHPL